MRIPNHPPDWRTAFSRLDPSRDVELLERVFLAGRGGLVNGKYSHWDSLRFQKPPDGLTRGQWWLGLKLARTQMYRALPVRDTSGRPFQFAMPDPVLRMVHEIDRDASGKIAMSGQVTDPGYRDRYIVNSLIEEAITSSQLEGAATTTRVAKQMLKSGRRPRDRSEQMIVNNYQAMRFVREFVHEELTPDQVRSIHRIVTRDTLADPVDSGRFRRADDVVVMDAQGNTIHVPPPAAELDERVAEMCRFANASEGEGGFLHPLLRAIVLHFWLAHDHPFVDGNGRTARALFYWSMLSSGFWLTEFLSISRILRSAPAEYPRSFLFSETDDNDVTYFIIYQLSVIQRAIGNLHQYLDRKQRELLATEQLLRGFEELNHRQVALLSHALKHPDHPYTIKSHQQSHNVSYQTARTDLLALSRLGILEERKRGRALVFHAPSNLADLLGRHVGGTAT